MDRRKLLAGLAGLPLTSVALPTLAAAQADPVIALHRQAAGCLAFFANETEDHDAEGDAVFDRLASLREAAFDLRATSLPGALAALEWARMEFAAHYVEPQADGGVPDWLDLFTLNMLDGAIAVLRQAVEGGQAHG